MIGATTEQGRHASVSPRQDPEAETWEHGDRDYSRTTTPWT